MKARTKTTRKRGRPPAHVDKCCLCPEPFVAVTPDGDRLCEHHKRLTDEIVRRALDASAGHHGRVRA